MIEPVDRAEVERLIRAAMPVKVKSIRWDYNYGDNACGVTLDVTNPLGQRLYGVCMFTGPQSVTTRIENFRRTVEFMLSDCAGCPNCAEHGDSTGKSA